MANIYDLSRFITAQERNYQDAFNEIRNGRKTSHWMWYIFPQIAGLGLSETANYYAIENLEEAQLYLEDKILGARLIQIAETLLTIDGKTAYQIFGSLDDAKLKSCMTLFNCIENINSVFQQVLDKYFDGKPDTRTLQILQRQ